MTKIEISKARDKFKEHMVEISRLKKITYKEGSSQVGELDGKIRSLINLAFDDGNLKN
jgi:hypothetical protein